jgi:hypothetical protein
MQYSSTCSHFLPLRSKYNYSQHPVLSHPQFVSIPYCDVPSFTPIQNNRLETRVLLFECCFKFTLYFIGTLKCPTSMANTDICVGIASLAQAISADKWALHIFFCKFCRPELCTPLSSRCCCPRKRTLQHFRLSSVSVRPNVC